MRWVCLLPVLSLAFAVCPPAASQTSTTSTKSSQNKASTGRTIRSKSKSSRAHRTPAPTYQLHPDPQRYQQIQQALADKGYFHGEVNGAWGDDSVDALKRFQADQKLPDDGKISAPTLIGLGLGPKHDTSATGSTSTSDPPK